MGNIPLPALNIRPPQQPEGPLDQYSKVMALQRMTQQQQMGDVQLQQQKLELGAQQAQNNAFKDAMKVDPTTGKMAFDRDAVSTSLANAGHGAKIPALLHSFNQLDQSAAALQKTRGEVQAQTATYLGDLAYSLQKTAKNADGSWNMDLVKANLSHAAADPAFGPKAVELWNRVQQDPNSLDQLTQGAIAASEKQRTVAAQETAAGARKGLVDKPTMATLAVAAAGGDESAKKALSTLKPDGPKTDVDKYITNYLAERGLDNTPANWAKAHKAYTNETKVQPGISRAEVFVNSRPVQVVDPNNPEQVVFTSAKDAIQSGAASPQSMQYQTAKGVQKAFTTGKPGEELAAFNTAIQHADLLSQAAGAIKNGDMRTLNSLRNKLKTEFGSADVTNFNVIAQAYTREVNKALTSGHITDSEIKEIGGTIPQNASPDQIMGAVNSYKQLMNSKVNIRKEQYEQGKQGKPNFRNGEQQQGGEKHATHRFNPQTGKVEAIP